MLLTVGRRLGPYEILAPLGAGGMGEVYRARDTRLGREVALKVLGPRFSSRPEARQRFEREARAIAALNHPHICQLHDIGRQDQTDYLVMELLEGEPLSARLRKGALPPVQALQLATQIADALDQAHRKGVIHRDLKPGNIMMTPTGAKLLDFGLAKTVPIAAGVEGSAGAETATALSGEGQIAGTLQYMAPEQLQGKDADPRTDIFALGAVLYETATGQRAFQAADSASLIAAILEREPAPMASLQPLAPPQLERLIRVCLAKDPNQRWQSVHDLLPQLRWIAEGPTDAPTEAPAPPAPRRAARAWVVAAAVSLLGLLALAWVHFREQPALPEMIRFSFPALLGGPLGSEIPSVSPDGRRVCFWSKDASGRELLWIRSLDSAAARPLEGTEGAGYHFWSPDGQSVVFFAEQKMKRISLAGGPAQSVVSVPGSGLVLGGDGNPAGDILLAHHNREPLYRLRSSGGAVQRFSTLSADRKENSHRWPHFLSASRFLYTARSSAPEHAAVYLAALDAPGGKKLAQAQSNAAYAPWSDGAGGYLLYVRDGNLLAHPFDADRQALAGEPATVAEHVYNVAPSSFAAFSVSRDGRTLAYRTARTPSSQLSWYDGAGRRLGIIGPPGQYSQPRLSRDGRRVALTQPDPRGGNRDVWILELSNELLSRLTRHPANDWHPVWSPDGRRIAFDSDRAGLNGVYMRSSTGESDEELVFAAPNELATPHDWSSDGRWVLIDSKPGKWPEGGLELLPLAGDRKPVPLVRTEFLETQGAFSPDGRFFAYTSDESGRFEVYVRAMPGGRPGTWRVSSAGGVEPVWRRDGRELFYVAPDKMLMAVPVPGKETLEPGRPRPLFRSCGYSFAQPLSRTYDLAPDGRFLLNCLVEETASAPVTVVVNWQAALKR